MFDCELTVEASGTGWYGLVRQGRITLFVPEMGNLEEAKLATCALAPRVAGLPEISEFGCIRRLG